MLDEAEIIEFEQPSGAATGRERARALAKRLPGVRVLPVNAAVPAAIALAVDPLEGEADDEPHWLALVGRNDQLAALRAGAAGVVGGDAGFDDLAAAVSAVRAGHAVLPVDLLEDLLPPEPAQREPGYSGPSLTPREVAVLQLLSEGSTNKMIARRLDISVHTAKFHVASILDKLDATTRTDAVAQGVRQGLLLL